MQNSDAARIAGRRSVHAAFNQVADALLARVAEDSPGLIERSFPGIEPVVFIPAFGSGVDPRDFGGVTGYSTAMGLGDGYLDFILYGEDTALKVTITPSGAVEYRWLGGPPGEPASFR